LMLAFIPEHERVLCEKVLVVKDLIA